MVKKISNTMKLSIIGVLAIVFLAPLCFAGAMYMNDNDAADPLGEPAFWWVDDDDSLVATNDLVVGKVSVHKVGYSYLGGTGVRNYTSLNSIVGADGIVEVMGAQLGAQSGAGANYIMFQLNMTVEDLVKASVDGFEVYVSGGDPYIKPVSVTLSYLYDSAGTGCEVTIASTLVPFNSTENAHPVGVDGYRLYAEIDPLSMTSAKWDSAAKTGVTVEVEVQFDQELNIQGEVLEFSIGLHSSEISPYTTMDTVAMILGGLFVIGAVFATPFVGSKGFKRRR